MLKRILLFLSILFVLPMVSYSHPHVFVLHTVKPVFDAKGFSGFEVVWNFDDMFGQMVISENDKNGDGKLSKKESDSVKVAAFDNLKNYEYFTFIEINNSKYKIRKVKNFTAYIVNKGLVYKFFIPCRVNATKKDKRITYASYDDSFYVDFYIDRKVKIEMETVDSITTKAVLKRNKKKSFYSGQYSPQEITINFRSK